MAHPTRPEPMNASPHHAKVRVSLKLGDPVFVAGKHVAGKIEVECRADKGLGIGVIMIELFAIQELTSRDHSATSTFQHSRRMFQGPGLPPSNAVQAHSLPGDPPLPPHHYHARRGTSSFLFRIPMPESAPSSMNLAGLAAVRYELRAAVGVAWKGERKLVTDTRELDVVESFRPHGVDGKDPEAVVVAEGGKIWVQGRLVGGVVVAGESACVELQVKNHSNKKNTGLTVTLTRTLVLPGISRQNNSPLQISDTLTTVPFRGPEYIIPPGAEGVASLVFDVPGQARGVKGGLRDGDESEARTTDPLFEIRCAVQVKMTMGLGSKDIILDLPPLRVPCAPMSPPLQGYVAPPQVWLPPPAPYAPYQYEPGQPYFFPPPPAAPLLVPMHTTPPRPAVLVWGAIITFIPGFASPPAHHSPQYAEGRGERASRIAHHLRMSSRNRSVSPSANRAPVLAPQHIVPPGPLHLQDMPLPPPHLTTDYLPISPTSSQQGLVHSPRPFLSPKLEYATDPLTHNSIPRSERVEDLERMAEKVEAMGTDMSGDIPVDVVDNNKTLPPPPVPTDKGRHIPSSIDRTRIDTFFAPPPVEMATTPLEEAPPTPIIAPMPSKKAPLTHDAATVLPERTPPTPALTAVTSAKVSQAGKTPPTPAFMATSSAKMLASEHQLSATGESGLDALERRLLAEVGTQRMDLTVGKRHADVRNVLPITIPPKVAVEPLNDSAISSLTLAGHLEERERELEIEHEQEQEQEQEHDSDERTHKAGRSNKSGDERDAIGTFNFDLGKAQGSLSVPRLNGLGDPSEQKGGKKRERKEGDRRKKKSAQGKVAAWLGGIQPDVPPPEDVPPPVPPISQEYKVASQPSSPPREAKKEEPSSPPNPRSSGFVPIGTLKNNTLQRHPIRDPTVVGGSNEVTELRSSALPATKTEEPILPVLPPRTKTIRTEKGVSPPSPNPNERNIPRVDKPGKSETPSPNKPVQASKRLPMFPPPRQDPEVKYDIRSARGGRGGQVTAITSIWASGALNDSRSPSKSPHKPPTPRFPSPKPVNPTNKPLTSTKIHTPIRAGAEPKFFDLAGKRTRPIVKSASVPAIVSDSHAIPTLSSTASLARPPHTQYKARTPTKVPSAIPEDQPDSGKARESATTMKPPSAKPTPTLPGDLAFGQARLRDLIKKYQGQAI
ncbi:hypothetical protein BD779DRAFT_1496977 [Infundibulicybe gibba]|nr:hypothetical protein BD779DRAFT_1496977 [Infundibulicybe gibba]